MFKNGVEKDPELNLESIVELAHAHLLLQKNQIIQVTTPTPNRCLRIMHVQ